jgi:4-hydroxythreonine-4-phosphate dehydrogenase
MKGKRQIVLALTMGDPAGVGPELVVRAASDRRLAKLARLVVYGSPEIVRTAAAKFAKGKMPEVKATGQLAMRRVPVGKTDAACGLAARDAVVAATKDALAGKVDGIVTAPMNKAAVNLAGVPFTGHTELIAELCEVRDYAMMQSAGKLRVAFVTTHLALKDVPKAVTRERVVTVGKLLWQAIRAEGVRAPRLAMAALNPHAGEEGHMGIEEQIILAPALKDLREIGIDIAGPFPPDTLFIGAIRRQFDGILSMYHDQGHIPFKMLAFDRGVNSTLGLPIIRTSVDHGTAFDIAWQGRADLGSLAAAIRLAAKRAASRKIRNPS